MPQRAVRFLEENYYPVPADPRYGDVVLFLKPDGSIVHAAVYLADGICFSKNGYAVTAPWMLTTIDDLVMQYTLEARQGNGLTVTYFRNKQI